MNQDETRDEDAGEAGLRRPKLAKRVAARLHFVDGQRLVILTDTEGGPEAQIGWREWLLLRNADGTRDLAGIMMAGKRAGAHCSREHLASFMEALASVGFLETPSPVAMRAARQAKVGLRLQSLPDYRLRCDGRGTCCRLYPTTTFLAAEVARARVHASEVLTCGHDETQAFTPEQGPVGESWEPRAVAMVDGRCAFLGDDNHCRIHAAAGAAAKPRGCQLFPATFVEDGTAVRVSVAPECACVLRSARGLEGQGEPIVPETHGHAEDLGPEAYVPELAETIPMTADTAMARADFVAWEGALAKVAMEAEDVPTALVAAAASLDGRDDAMEAVIDEELGALAERLRRRMAVSGWRSPHDLARRVPVWIEAALERRSFEGAPADAVGERFYARAVLFGHMVGAEATARRPVAGELRARAARLVLARGLAAVATSRGPDDDRLLEEPIALVEAFARGYGVA